MIICGKDVLRGWLGENAEAMVCGYIADRDGGEKEVVQKEVVLGIRFLILR